MTHNLSPEEWAQVRYKYEHTDEPVDDICLDYGVSPNTLRDRVRRWGWTRRVQPISAEGPPPMRPIAPAFPAAPARAPIALALTPTGVAAPIESAATPARSAATLPIPQAALADEAPANPAEIAPRLQGAVARVLPAIEATVAQLAAGPMPPREMERAARTLTSLTRTLRELNELLREQQPPQGGRICDCEDDMPEDIDAFRYELARRIEAFVESRRDLVAEGVRPPEGFVPYGG